MGKEEYPIEIGKMYIRDAMKARQEEENTLKRYVA